MASIYSIAGIILQGLIMGALLASSPAEAQSPRDVKITLASSNSTLEKAFQMIEKKTDFKFLYSSTAIPLAENVNVDFENESIQKILEYLAQEFSLSFNIINEQIIVKKVSLPEESSIVIYENGSVKGYVTDAGTKEPLQGVTVAIKGTTIGTFTDKRGYFEINNIKPGKYILVASYVGYTAAAKGMEIISGRLEEMNFQLNEGVVGLDEVVVTGSISERSIRESANPVTVITPKELENRDLNTLRSVLQTVPGLLLSQSGDLEDPTTGGRASSGMGVLNIRGYSPTSTLSGNTKYIVDGVELFSASGLNTINPNNIEKIEVSRGPMASTLYGAGSSGGIVQIFSKKGVSAGGLKLDIKTSVTKKESKYYDDSSPLNQEYTINLNGGKPDFNYRLSANYAYAPISRYTTTAGVNENDISISGGMNGSISNIKVDLTASYSKNNYGNAVDYYWYKIALEDGWANPTNMLTLVKGQLYETKSGTEVLGVNLKHPLSDNIYHQLNLGLSNMQINTYYLTPTTVSSTSSYNTYKYNMTRQTIKYFLNLIQPIFTDFKVNFTGGFDFMNATYENSTIGYTSIYADNISQTINANYSGTSQIQTDQTTGFFSEAVWGYKNKLFLTTGFRAERNLSAGDDVGWYKMPRIGLTYVQELGDFSFKPRFSWGRSTQAVSPAYKMEKTVTVASIITYNYIGNKDLKPQSQVGYETGLDIFYKDFISFGITYYNQKIEDMIQLVQTYTAYFTYTCQYINVSEVYNKGIEANLKLILSPFTLDIVYNHIKSTYGAGFTYSSSTPYIYDGGRVFATPSGSYTLRLSYQMPSLLSWTNKGGNISFEYVWKGDELAMNSYDYWKRACEAGKVSGSYTYKIYDGYGRFNVRGDYALLNSLSFYFDISNLLKEQPQLQQSAAITGRKICVGFNYNIL